MRTYVVQSGDTPARIAIHFAGCPKCARDLVLANSHKQSVTYPNGFITFRELRVGERLNLPDKWFSKEFDELPSSYFAALPYADGHTPGKPQVGVLGDEATLDKAAAQTNALASKDDQSFSNSADGVAALIDSSVQEAFASTNPTVSAVAQTVHISTAQARASNASLKIALASGDQAGATKARLDTQNALSTAVEAARITLQVMGANAPWDVKIGGATIEPTVYAPAPAPSPAPTPRAPQPKAPAPAPVIVAAPQQPGVSTAAMLTMGVLGVGVVGGAIYWVLTKPPRIRRVREEGDQQL